MRNQTVLSSCALVYMTYRVQDEHQVSSTVVASNGAEVPVTSLPKGFAGVADLHSTAQHDTAGEPHLHSTTQHDIAGELSFEVLCTSEVHSTTQHNTAWR